MTFHNFELHNYLLQSISFSSLRSLQCPVHLPVVHHAENQACAPGHGLRVVAADVAALGETTRFRFLVIPYRGAEAQPDLFLNFSKSPG